MLLLGSLALLFPVPTMLYQGGEPVLQAELYPGHVIPLNKGFGSDVAFHGDWLAIVQGHPPSDPGLLMFRRQEGTWQRVETLHPSYMSFWSRVNFSGDSVAVSSGYGGSADVFTFDGSAWLHEANFTAVGQPQYLGAYFGWSLALDGNRVAIAGMEPVNSPLKGFVSIFERQAGAWSLVEVIPAPAASGCQFGNHVALSGDWLLVRAYTKSFCGPDVHLFERTSSGWTLRLSLANGLAAIALADDLMVHGRDVYRRTGSTWKLEGTLPPGPGSGAGLGLEDVSIDDGRIALGDPSADFTEGAAYVYERIAGSWTVVAKIGQGGWESLEGIGNRLDMQGNRVVLGAPWYNGPFSANVYIGRAFVYAISTEPSIYCVAKLDSQGCLPAIAFQGSASLSDPLPFDISVSQVLNNANGLLLYGFGPDAEPFLGGTLCVSPPVRRTGAQASGGTPPPAVDCSGTYSFDMNAHAQQGDDPLLVPGAEVGAQYWYRDSNDPSGSGLSDAVSFVLAP
jgi:hypothetical protein